jgi:hypothetical protein
VSVAVNGDAIPAEQRSSHRWAVWRSETADGQLFEERRAYQPFKEYPGCSGTLPVEQRHREKQGADLALALTYLAFRPGEYEGVAYLREDGGTDYYRADAGAGGAA